MVDSRSPPHSPQSASPPVVKRYPAPRHVVSPTVDDDSPSPPLSPDSRQSTPRGNQSVRQRAPRDTTQLRRTSDGAPTLRESHGLSWTSTTRDSVVDNLILSLDNFSGASSGSANMIDPDFDRDRFRPPPFQFNMKPTQRMRGHTHSSSLSSELEPTSSPRSIGSTGKRSRRSNSSSHFPLHGLTNRVKMTSPRASDAGRTSTDTPKSTGRKEKGKERERERIDAHDEAYGYVTLAEKKRASRGLRNSMSLDHLYSEANIKGGSILDRGRPTYDATPVSRSDRIQSPNAAGSLYDQFASQSMRKTSAKSDFRGAPHLRGEFARNNSVQSVGLTALPQDVQDTPMSPTQPASRHKDTPPQLREKQGFFKRVFGGSTRTGPATTEFAPSTLDDSARSNENTNANVDKPRSAGSTVKPESRNAPKDTPTQSSQVPPSLNKKPSSFFRRRKNQVQSDVPPPVPVKDKQFNVAVQQDSPSTSSLRKIMDPYLNEDDTKRNGTPTIDGNTLDRTGTRHSAADSDDLDIFHPGYSASPGTPKMPPVPTPKSSSTSKNFYDRDASPSSAGLKIKKRNDENFSPIFDRFSGENSRRDASSKTVEPRKTSLLSDSRAKGRDTSLPSTKGPVLPHETMRAVSSGTDMVNKRDDDSASTARLSRPFTTEGAAYQFERLQVESNTESKVRRGSADSVPDSRDPSRNASLVSTVPPTGVIPTTNPESNTPGTEYHSAHSLPLPSVLLEGNNLLRKSIEVNGAPPLPPKEGIEAQYTERARKIFEGDEEDVARQEAASWLGEQNETSSRTLIAYMQLFDLQGMNILAALRALCGKLLLRGETQQFDRIITALSARWCDCNPRHGLKAQDVVHTICYSLILLNTDLHMADIGEKMSRNAYVKNTLPTIRRVVMDAAPGAFEDSTKPAQTRPGIPWMDSSSSMPTSPVLPSPGTPTEEISLELPKQSVTKRLSLRPGMMRMDGDGSSPDSASTSNLLVNNPWTGSVRGWEAEVENMLKSFWTSIRTEPLPLLATDDKSVADRNESVSGGLKRSGSIVSKAPSESISYRSKPSGLRSLTSGWGNRNTRSRQNLYPYSGSSIAASSRTSFDDGNTMWSPSQSNVWTKNSLLSKTLTSASMSSLGNHLSPIRGDFKHSIGFANALSQAIIREEVANGGDDTDSIVIPGGLLEDEALALEGAPWAKEGLVKHKHHRTTEDKKSKERSWTDCFAVISKGKLTLFAFGSSSKSQSSRNNQRAKSSNGRAASIATATVGGGDWMENAECLESFVLRQTTATRLPPPGYSKNRPHVWALSLPSGAVHLFQVGTPDIAKEFMTTANYWSARLSKEPLVGGVSNIEYGWSDNVLIPAALSNVTEGQVSPPSSAHNPTSPHKMHSSGSAGTGSGRQRPSFQSSIRGSFDAGIGSAKARLQGDKAQIAEWKPPTQSMMASQLLEVDQLKALSAYVRNVEDDLAKHNELKPAIDLTYNPRHANHGRVMSNWQRKSEYLLREIVKFQMYADALEAAQKARQEYNLRKEKMDQVRERITSMEASRLAGGDTTPRAVTSPVL